MVIVSGSDVNWCLLFTFRTIVIRECASVAVKENSHDVEASADRPRVNNIVSDVNTRSEANARPTFSCSGVYLGRYVYEISMW